MISTVEEKTTHITSKSVPDNERPKDIEKRVRELAAKSTPLYKNANLLGLYLRLIPGCLVPALTLGYDGSMMTGLQSVPSWETCKLQTS
jgi:hypothetical protein